MGKRICFLDFDGVLNTMGGFMMDEDKYDKFESRYESMKEAKNFIYNHLKDSPIGKGLWNIYDLDIDLVTKLNTLVEEADVYFVISSAWRIGSSIDELRLTLCLTGFMYPYRVIDKTINASGVRGLEIHEWLNRESNKNEWSDYVIIDDETCDIEGYHDDNRIFKVETLTDCDVKKVVDYFNKKSIDI